MAGAGDIERTKLLLKRMYQQGEKKEVMEAVVPQY
jgi:hypothetical protein